ncbi:ATP-binding protein [Ferroplasma sp.]|uniref:ATP-binding protein n=1 Tax=Ferroplasma sp. TaxID=2591003 RepID=UPI00260ED461|nr:ATP-binding protein [Ferroplasma sp.]
MQASVKLDVIDLIGRRQYSGKITWLREYIQNAIDAGSSDFIEIDLKDSDFVITDHGKGMTEAELYSQAFSIGDSKKSQQEIGELGIGMYAGTGICDRMSMITKTKDSKEAIQADLDMVLYRDLIRQDPMPTFEYGITKILQTKKTEPPIEAKSFTIIRFENINREALAELGKENLIDFILKTVDIPISNDFPKKDQVTNFLKKDATEIQVFINYNGELMQTKKFNFPGIEFASDILKEELHSEDGRLIGKVWGAYNKEGESFPGSGIVVKRKGLTIGDESYLVSRFNSKPLPRFVGEIIVLDDKIEVNTSRDWFVSSPNLDDFVSKASKVLYKFYDVSNFDSSVGKRMVNLAQDMEKQEKMISEYDKKRNVGAKFKAEEKKEGDQDKLLKKATKAEDYMIKFTKGKIDKNDQYNKLKAELVKRALEDQKVNSIINSPSKPPVAKSKKNPWPKIVKTFIETNVIDTALAERIYEKKDAKDLTNNAFTFIEQKLKKLLGKGEQENIPWNDLLKEFKSNYKPPDLKGFDEERYMQAFNGIMNGMYTILRHSSGHSFMDDMNDQRTILEIMLIADFIVRWIDQWQPK